MSREKAKVLGCVYWEDFFKSTRGNHWRVEPTKTMITGIEIYQLKRTPVKRNLEGECIGWGEEEVCQVLFDRNYVEAYKKKYYKLYSVLEFLEVKNIACLEDKFNQFESSTGLVLSKKNPRQSTYLKFKEFCNETD